MDISPILDTRGYLGMCDYSLAHLKNRHAQRGEELVTMTTSNDSVGLCSPRDRNVAVCLPPGATLLVENIPVPVRMQLGVSQTEFGTFDQFDMAENHHRDGVRFPNGKQILIQQLKGIRVTVLSLDASTERQPAPAEPVHTYAYNAG